MIVKRKVSEILGEYELREFEDTSTSPIPLSIIVEEHPGPTSLPYQPDYHMTQVAEEPIVEEKYAEVRIETRLQLLHFRLP